MQVGLDQQTSANCKSKLWFGLDIQLSTLVLKFNFIFSNQQWLSADGILIPNLHKAPPLATIFILEQTARRYLFAAVG